jgi:transglutaminase-like putative cysteine protease
MRIRIEHITSFAYDHPISEAYTEMRLRPLDGNGQHCLSFSLVTEPHDETLKYNDRFGNAVHHFDVIQPHQKLMVAAKSEVLTPDHFLEYATSLSPLDEHDYLMATHYAPLSKEIIHFAAACAVPGDPKASAFALMQAIHARLIYEKGATDVTTTAEEALRLGRGVCQDFSHLMLAACRSQNIPVRYVSGYLYNNGHIAASHAWVDVYIAGEGWISLDPTHNCEQAAEYVRVAIGSDYADVPPTRGVFVGNAKETMDVTVKVSSV